MKKRIFILMICFAFLIGFQVLASDTWSLGQSADPTELDSNFTETTKVVLGTMQWIGYLIAIGMIIWAGIRFLVSGAGEKAKAKEVALPIVIGAVLIAGATWIAHLIFNL